MNSICKIGILLFLGFCILNSFARNNTKEDNAILFTDRDYCISGDTVWFKVLLPENPYEKGNVVRVQFETASGNLIAGVAKKAKDGWAEGYFHVPDSLSTGQCFVSAFLNAQRNEENLKVKAKSLLVYNRFEDRILELNLISSVPALKKEDFSSIVQLNTDKNSYSTREEVKVSFNADSEIDFSNVVIKANLIDPLAAEIPDIFRFEVGSSNENIPDFIEQDGVLINGVVKDASGELQKGVLVILSITCDPHYFDYNFTGNEGDFHFFLKNAVGKAKIVLQIISESNDNHLIQLEEDYLQRKDNNAIHSKILTPEQTEFISSVIEADFMSKIFNPVLITERDSFSIPPRFSLPFYGKPTRRVVPEEFIDLPNFQVISREILPGLQYRLRNGEIAFRMINQNQNSFFENEPLRLINGIPVFENSLFANLKSTDISYIDIVQNERIFGDLKLSGVLSVSLFDKSNFWAMQIPQINEFRVNCLQPDKKPEYLNLKPRDKNIPDFRQTYLWRKLKSADTGNVLFKLSDMKGNVEISIEGFTKANTFFKASKIIEVK